MKEQLAERFAVKHEEVRMIDSEAKNLQYIVCDEGGGIVISGVLGMTGLTLEQAKTLTAELPEILSLYF